MLSVIMLSVFILNVVAPSQLHKSIALLGPNSIFSS